MSKQPERLTNSFLFPLTDSKQHFYTVKECVYNFGSIWTDNVSFILHYFIICLVYPTVMPTDRYTAIEHNQNNYKMSWKKGITLSSPALGQVHGKTEKWLHLNTVTGYPELLCCRLQAARSLQSSLQISPEHYLAKPKKLFFTIYDNFPCSQLKAAAALWIFSNWPSSFFSASSLGIRCFTPL